MGRVTSAVVFEEAMTAVSEIGGRRLDLKHNVRQIREIFVCKWFVSRPGKKLLLLLMLFDDEGDKSFASKRVLLLFWIIPIHSSPSSSHRVKARTTFSRSQMNVPAVLTYPLHGCTPRASFLKVECL
jgi:hypothetical protein